MSDELCFELNNNVATIRINRPEKRNSFTDEMIRQWVDWLDECAARDDVKVIVFTGSEGSFSAGGDTSGLEKKSKISPLDAKNGLQNNTQALARKVMEIDKPILAAVNGLAVGGGMDLALMCDVVLASSSARFAETYAKMGLLPGVGGAWFLPRKIGVSAALDLFWTGRRVDAQEARELGIVTRVFAEDRFENDVREYAENLAQAAPLSVRYIKRLVYQGVNTDLNTHLDALSSHLALVRTSEDSKEAIAAFKEKRKPNFTGK